MRVGISHILLLMHFTHVFLFKKCKTPVTFQGGGDTKINVFFLVIRRQGGDIPGGWKGKEGGLWRRTQDRKLLQQEMRGRGNGRGKHHTF